MDVFHKLMEETVAGKHYVLHVPSYKEKSENWQ